MGGKSPVRVNEDERQALVALSGSGERAEADRARAILLTLSGWTSGRIAEAFGVREDSVRFWRSAFMRHGLDALKAHPGAGSRSGQGAGRLVGGRGGFVGACRRSAELDPAAAGAGVRGPYRTATAIAAPGPPR